MRTFTNNQSMKKTIVACAVVATMTITPVMAEENNIAESTIPAQTANDKENIGFGTGAVLGAIVAGPLGAFVAGMVGVFTAKHINVLDEKEALSLKLNDESNKHQLALNKYQQNIKLVQQKYQQELLAIKQTNNQVSQLQAENLLMSLQFSTGSSEIQPHYHEQISSLVSILELSPGLTIDLSGYTDLQGSDELNHALSIARVNAVKDALVAKGVADQRINLFAFGETSPVVANNEKETSFYDRRVVIKFNLKNEDNKELQTVSYFK
ncbi:sortase-associated OmpA-like protein PdsO [Colwelliaceae bacterium 6441]